MQGIFKAPYLLNVIFISLMSLTTYSHVPKFLNPPKIQSSTKTFMPTIPKLTIYSVAVPAPTKQLPFSTAPPTSYLCVT